MKPEVPVLGAGNIVHVAESGAEPYSSLLFCFSAANYILHSLLVIRNVTHEMQLAFYLLLASS